jgi:hypothetical protein
VDHLAQEKYALTFVFFKRFIADLYSILNTIAKTKMTGDVKFYGTEIQNSRTKILLAQIF